MTDPKIRKLLITLHLLFAGFLTPAFLLVAITGGNYLLGNKGSVESTPINLPADAALDFNSETLQADVEALLEQAKIEHDFEYIRNRGRILQLRPTSRAYMQFEQKPDGLTASMNKPSLQAGLMELHKGHGPKMFKTYQKIVALGLVLVVLGGFLVGILARTYRRKTLLATGLGTLLFIALAFA